MLKIQGDCQRTAAGGRIYEAGFELPRRNQALGIISFAILKWRVFVQGQELEFNSQRNKADRVPAPGLLRP
jgi:hypothetical protein